MRKTIMMIMLCVSGIAGYSQQDTTIYLEELKIQENRIRVPFSESNKSISLIRREKLNIEPVHSLSNALSYVPGVDVRSRGVTGTQADLSIRGSTFDENLVLLNGIKLTDPQTGHHLMNLPVSFQDIERVEVLKGAAARIYGQNAYAGVINIITKTPDEPLVFVSGYGGIGPSDSKKADSTFQDYGATGLSASISLPGEILSHYLSVSRDASNGHRYNSDYAANNIYYNSILNFDNSKLNFQGGYSWREFGANGFYAGNEEREEVQTTMLSLDYELNLDQSFIKSSVYTRINKDNYVFNWQHPEWFHNVHQTVSNGLELHYSNFNGLGNTGIGMELRNESIEGIESEQLAANALLNDDERWNAGIYLEHRYENGNFSMTPGMYLNWHNEYGWSAFPGIDLGYDFSDKARIYANVGRTYRIPTFFDLHYASASAQNYGNANLEPGIANNYELGFKFMDANFVAEVNGFAIDGVSSIDWVSRPDVDSVTWQAMNFDNVKKLGTEVRLFFDWGKNNPEAFVQQLDVNYTYIYSDLQDSRFKSRYALSNLKDQLNVLLTHKIAGDIYNTISSKYRNRPDMTDEEILNGIEDFEDYWLLDMRVFYKMEKGMIYLEGSNLLDTEYVEVGNVTMPGRWYRVGFQFEIGI